MILNLDMKLSLDMNIDMTVSLDFLHFFVHKTLPGSHMNRKTFLRKFSCTQRYLHKMCVRV